MRDEKGTNGIGIRSQRVPSVEKNLYGEEVSIFFFPVEQNVRIHFLRFFLRFLL